MFIDCLLCDGCAAEPNRAFFCFVSPATHCKIDIIILVCSPQEKSRFGNV